MFGSFGISHMLNLAPMKMELENCMEHCTKKVLYAIQFNVEHKT